MKRSIGIRKRIEGVFVSCLLFVFLTGCNSEVTLRDGTNLQLDKDGGATITYIEEFPSDYYDIAELQEMNAEEVAEYNAMQGEEAVSVVSTTTDGSKITLVMHFTDVEDYGNMNEIPIYSGTVSQAVAMGYDFNRIFKDAKSGEVLTDIDWTDRGERHVLIINEDVSVYPYNKIVMVTDNVTVSENSKVATVTDEKQAVIVFK